MHYNYILIRFHYFLLTDCPGTGSEDAGKASACQGCPNQTTCSALPKGPDPGKTFIPLSS